MNALLPAEAELIGFLQDPASYPHRPASVQLVQTHISWVALAPPYVYKVKKPIDFGFLDFSTLAKRKHFCEQEVVLNRRLCHRIYEGVVPIRWDKGAFSFEGTGEPIEYAVKMQQLPPEGFLDRLLRRKQAGPQAIDRIVRKLVAFYRNQTTTPEMAAWGHVDKLKISTDENFAQTMPFVGTHTLPRVPFEAIRYFTTLFFEREHDLLERRAAEGYILDCHGDLRAEHAHLSDAGVCIYDCIEFNERFRYIDVASDIAFLAMDLCFLGHPQLSRYLVRRVSEALGDAGLLRLLPFYACYRAYVRGKVELLQSDEVEVPSAQRAACRKAARRYFQLALSYAIAGEEPAVIVVMGRVGTGKSTLAQALAQALGWEVISSDIVRKTMAGVPVYHRGDAAERMRLYSRESTARTYSKLRDQALANARAGRSTILDATYSRRHHRDALRKWLKHENISYHFIEATAPDERLRTRLAQRAQQEQVISDARLEDFERLTARYEAPGAEEDEHLLSVLAVPTPEQTVLAALKIIISRRLSESAFGQDRSLVH